MSKTLSQMASAVLRNCQIPEDTSESSVKALADAKAYLNERANDVWSRRLWREFIILGTYTVPAGAQTIALADIVIDTRFNTAGKGYDNKFDEVAGMRQGSNPLLPEDPGAINMARADLWEYNGSPVRFITRGKSGLFLLGSFTQDTVLSFFGKAKSKDLSDSETWILDNDQCLIAGASGDMIRDNDRDDNRAQIRYTEYEGEIAKMIDAAEAQGANLKRVIPWNPFTNHGNAQLIDTSKTGQIPYYGN